MHKETTYRPTVQGMENELCKVHPVLNKGFVRVIDYMGDDAAIVQAARVSYGKGTKTPSSDRGLIRYLMRHRHSTPFEMCEIKLHVKLPLFVARQWVRHRTANINEISGRYSILDHEFYLPDPEQLAEQLKTNRQGRGAPLPKDLAMHARGMLEGDANRVYSTYEYLLNDNGEGGKKWPDLAQLTRELARINLTLNYYTQWYWKIDLHNLFHFLSLRLDDHAQYEIRAYAQVIEKIVSEWVPFAYEAFKDYRLNGVFFSKQELDEIRKNVDPEKMTYDGIKNERERRELKKKLTP